MKKKIEAWELLKSEEVFAAAPWIRLSVQHLRLPDGREVEDFYQIGLPEYVVVCAQTADGTVVMERLYKPGVGKVVLTLPSGMIEDGEEPLTAAKRELLEETGYASNHWQCLGRFVPNGNYGCGKAHLFVARKARQVARPNPDDLEDIEVILSMISFIILAD